MSSNILTIITVLSLSIYVNGQQLLVSSRNGFFPQVPSHHSENIRSHSIPRIARPQTNVGSRFRRIHRIPSPPSIAHPNSNRLLQRSNDLLRRDLPVNPEFHKQTNDATASMANGERRTTIVPPVAHRVKQFSKQRTRDFKWSRGRLRKNQRINKRLQTRRRLTTSPRAQSASPKLEQEPLTSFPPIPPAQFLPPHFLESLSTSQPIFPERSFRTTLRPIVRSTWRPRIRPGLRQTRPPLSSEQPHFGRRLPQQPSWKQIPVPKNFIGVPRQPSNVWRNVTRRPIATVHPARHRPKIDANEEFLKCCKGRNVDAACESRCNFDNLNRRVLTAMFVGSDQCPQSNGRDLLSCAAQDSDYTDCCRAHGVHLTAAGDKCIGFCQMTPGSEFQVDVGMIPCWSVLKEIKECFKSGLIKKKNLAELT